MGGLGSRGDASGPTLLFVDLRIDGARVLKTGGVGYQGSRNQSLRKTKAEEGAGGGGKLKIVPYTVHHLSFRRHKGRKRPPVSTTDRSLGKTCLAFTSRA